MDASLLKLGLTMIAGTAATAAAFGRDLSSLFGSHRSLFSQIKDEQEQLQNIDKLLRELKGDEGDGVTARQALEADRGVTLGRLRRLTEEFSRQREDPNYDLSFGQRMFVLFRPESQRAEIVHWGAWAFLAVGLIAIFSGILLSRQLTSTQPADQGASIHNTSGQTKNQPQPSQLPEDNAKADPDEYIADFALLGCVGFLLFRGWALSERRSVHGYDSNDSVVRRLFVLKRPANFPMFAAQGCFWSCVYWVIEGTEDFVHDSLVSEPTPAVEVLLKSLTPLLVAAVCRQWANSELQSAEENSSPGWRRVSITMHPGWNSLAILTSFAFAVLAGAFMVCRTVFQDEPEHRIALVLQCVVLCIACSQWLAHRNTPAAQVEPAAGKASSAVA